MPEGPEIRRVADRLAAAAQGKPLTGVWFACPEMQTYQGMLVGEQITAVETRGKAMLTHFSNGLTLYSHNQLYGVWRIVATGEELQTNRVLRVRLATADQTLLLYSASDVQLLNAEGLTSHPFLSKAGPDVLDSQLDSSQVKARLLSASFRRRQLSALLLDQGFLAGLGNYLRVEILWQAALAPQHKAENLSEAQLDALAESLLALPRLSYRTRGQRGKQAFRFNVFHREGKACARCGGNIERTTLSSRPFYWCPRCQQ